MKVITDRKGGLFPTPTEISFNCSCPDWASMCKHVAATLYGIGARLDSAPELLFRLRRVDHRDLFSAVSRKVGAASTAASEGLSPEELGDLFGIEIDSKAGAAAAKATKKRKALSATVKKNTTLPAKVAKKETAATVKKNSKASVKVKTKEKSPTKKKPATKKKRATPARKTVK